MLAKQNNTFFYKIIMKQNAMKIQPNNEKKKTYLILLCYVFKYFYTKGMIKPYNNSILIIK